jgi:hypothetical protein
VPEIPEAVLREFGLSEAIAVPLSGGVINQVWRIDSGDESYVLKRYAEATEAQMHQSILVQNIAGARGVDSDS